MNSARYNLWYVDAERNKVRGLPRFASDFPGIGGQAALVKRASTGDRKSFDILVAVYTARLKGFLALRVNAADIDDLAQDIWMTCWSRLPSLQSPGSFKPWLYGIAVNKCHEARRGRLHDARTASLDEAGDISSGEMLLEDSVVLRDTVARSLAALPNEQRDVLDLYYYSQLTLPEIATALERNLNTVKYQFYRGHDCMASTLQRGENDDMIASGGNKR